MLRVPAERETTETWVRASTIIGVDVVEHPMEEGWQVLVHQVVGNHERTLTVTVPNVDQAHDIRDRLLWGALGMSERTVAVPAIADDATMVTTVEQPDFGDLT